MYLQIGRHIKTLISTNQSVFVKGESVVHLPRRCAGHSKWQNIKSTKELMDRTKSTKFSKLSNQIARAVNKNGDDPSLNIELKKLLEEAQKSNMPKATIQKGIQLGKTETSLRPYWILCTGPKDLVLGLEVVFANPKINFLNTKLHLRKLNLKLEARTNDFCDEKGIIIVDLAENVDKSYDAALEDAIEIGVNEVHETDDKCLIFECLPDRVESVSQQLTKRGYNISSATTELEFKTIINFSENEVQEINSTINKLQNDHEEILRAVYNIETQ